MPGLIRFFYFRVSGKRVRELLSYISRKKEDQIASSDIDRDLKPIEETSFYREMQENRIGNLLEASRLKTGRRIFAGW